MSLLASLLDVFASTVLPVFLVATAGFILVRKIPLDGRTLGRIVFYLASPSLVFRSLYGMNVTTTALQHELVVVTSIYLVTGLIGWLLGRDLRRGERSALTLASAISNNGNMGLPISLFALGEAGLALATVYYAISAFLTNTLGVIVASTGSTSLGRALRQSLQAPVLYAAVLGLTFNLLAVPVPDTLYRAIEIMAGAAIPSMLVLLGIQLSATRIESADGVVWRSTFVRLIISPVVAIGLCLLLGVGGLERQVLVLQAAMPTAVVTTVLATEFNTKPTLVATAVLFSTIASMATLSVVLLLI
ncbi:MAG: AEC family transporter [Caldilineaceae bacterium]|nr:AEC family transporter [Caldilineaceae bacterium]